VLDASELSDVGENKRLTLLVCLVHTARIRARDEVVTMFFASAWPRSPQRPASAWRNCARLTGAESERLLGVFGEVLAGVREALGPAEPEDSEGQGLDAASPGVAPIGAYRGSSKGCRTWPS
jgi:hypothetical protein